MRSALLDSLFLLAAASALQARRTLGVGASAESPLKRRDMFLHLDRRHAALAPRAAAAPREMKKDGPRDVIAARRLGGRRDMPATGPSDKERP